MNFLGKYAKTLTKELVRATINESSGRGGIGRRARFRFWWQPRAGSSPVTRTITSVLIGFKKFYENTRFFVPYMFHTATQALVSK